MTDTPIDTSPPNTPEQEAFHEAREAAAQDEATWPIFQVMITGDKTEWAPRPNPTYWEEDGNGKWLPKAEADLPEHASLNENGQVEMEAVAVVTCHARNEDHARMIALRANEDYHTVAEVKRLDPPAE